MEDVRRALEHLALVPAATELPRFAREPLGGGLRSGLRLRVDEVDDGSLRRCRRSASPRGSSAAAP